ncbi:endonuclease/exonuclease/phosphatase family protein [Anaeramoeba ignava]|uniref:Endonuclease/exonuclease/phosphatase family protein n=1 Tax=Anaeramoeba ignava TaxID=1746090 RepID=A0A9Q0R952_ANAIG|nr:endonuclease/exonuclease/phosphatase family protein [Anaeramoeba ignava]
MKLILVLFVSLLFVFVELNSFDCDTVVSPGDRRRDKNKLRVCSFNPEYLFDGVDDSSSGCPWETSSAATKHLEKVAQVLEAIDCDLISLYEVEDCEMLSRLNDLLSGYDYHYYIMKGTDTSTRQQTSILTRIDPTPLSASTALLRSDERVWFPVSGSNCGYTGSGSSYGVSKNHYAVFEMNGLEILLIGAHLRAFPTSAEPCARREAQALVLRKLAEDEGFSKGREVIVMGDLNDYSDIDPDINSDQPLSRVLRFIREGESSSSDLLINTASLMSQDMRYSCWWDKNYNDYENYPEEDTQIDHVLMSQGLINKVSNAYIYHSIDVSYPETNFNGDHYPVVVDLEFN